MSQNTLQLPQSNPEFLQLTQHYLAVLDHQQLCQFVQGQAPCENTELALLLCQKFQRLVDIANIGAENNIAVIGIIDVDKKMFQLFNLVYNFMLNHGFEAQWQQAADENRTLHNSSSNH